MVRINSLTIKKLGNVAPDTELTFGPKGAVLLGRNGTGKTTLLNLLASIGRCDLPGISDDDYEISFSVHYSDEIALNVTAQHQKDRVDSPVLSAGSAHFTTPGLDEILNTSKSAKLLRIEAVHQTLGERILIESDGSQTRCTLPDGTEVGSGRLLFQGWTTLVLGLMINQKPSWLQPGFGGLLALQNRLYRFDEGLDYFSTLTNEQDHTPLIAATRFHVSQQPPFINTGARRMSFWLADRLAEDFFSRDERTSFGTSSSTEVEYLRIFCKLTGFEHATITAELDEEHLVEAQEIANFAPLRFSVSRNGSRIHHRHLSFGQARLLAFLHYHDSTPDLVIADELVNGMHYDWIEACLQRIANSQAFLSSQNPLLFDFLPLESPEDVAQRFICCDLDDQHRFVWRNMSLEDARELYETRKVGLQHTSEILRTRGYW